MVRVYWPAVLDAFHATGDDGAVVIGDRIRIIGLVNPCTTNVKLTLFGFLVHSLHTCNIVCLSPSPSQVL